ncbi:MAG: hypothetical protein H6R26_504 [Proteobacteria bacterium]|nr:hypothetical protein [Pseudomonadota bacterium]
MAAVIASPMSDNKMRPICQTSKFSHRWRCDEASRVQATGAITVPTDGIRYVTESHGKWGILVCLKANKPDNLLAKSGSPGPAHRIGGIGLLNAAANVKGDSPEWSAAQIRAGRQRNPAQQLTRNYVHMRRQSVQLTKGSNFIHNGPVGFRPLPAAMARRLQNSSDRRF